MMVDNIALVLVKRHFIVLPTKNAPDVLWQPGSSIDICEKKKKHAIVNSVDVDSPIQCSVEAVKKMPAPNTQ